MPRVTRDPPCPLFTSHCALIAEIPRARRYYMEPGLYIDGCSLREKCRYYVDMVPEKEDAHAQSRALVSS